MPRRSLPAVFSFESAELVSTCRPGRKIQAPCGLDMTNVRHPDATSSPAQLEEFMRLALRLASGGRGKTSPNPMVGAVVVRAGKVVGTGCHRYPGGPHAEVVAIEKAGKLAKGSALFVTLEPCCHYGRTPPCVTKIVEAGISGVFASIVDPDPRVRGKGFRFLRQQKVKVNVGLLAEEAGKLNEAYIKWVTEKRPFVAVKVCESLDGRIATSSGQSRGLGSEEEIEFAHALRARYDAVLVGVGTVLADNPKLTVRNVRGRNPHRIVLDSRLRTPVSSKMLKRDGNERVIVVSVEGVAKTRVEALESRGIEVWTLPGKKGRVNLESFLSEAAGRSIQSILVEGGSDVITSFLKGKLVDKVYVAIAPKILGGTQRVSWPKELGIRSVTRGLGLKELRVRRLGTDILVEGYL
ncbi:MAG: bifunctional diaminohydroxyphosphoribosylaminopyrimidine deaminase/5-amino-6-(5-phosphoribosylamino)uracil reductase RibD [Candidatus Eisenbacteria bacterium]|nr:bifunctional diaminohydroxyphosphoribosylaminopyrimidine deaminase/5-amino-6-(5-phosphoribosylamino)uracil reductase RibD [Candidatus Eisenbacteria bacterium]